MPRTLAALAVLLAALLTPAPAGAALFHDGFNVRDGDMLPARRSNDGDEFTVTRI